ncbi:MAG: hypothetical protein ACRCX2_04820 [Paraclostridium sp.]
MEESNTNLLKTALKSAIADLSVDLAQQQVVDEFKKLQSKDIGQIEHQDVSERVSYLQSVQYSPEAYAELKTIHSLVPKIINQKEHVIVDNGAVLHKSNLHYDPLQSSSLPDDMTALSSVYHDKTIIKPIGIFAYNGQNANSRCDIYPTKNSLFNPDDFMSHNREQLLYSNDEFGGTFRENYRAQVDKINERDILNGYTRSLSLV